MASYKFYSLLFLTIRNISGSVAPEGPSVVMGNTTEFPAPPLADTTATLTPDQKWSLSRFKEWGSTTWSGIRGGYKTVADGIGSYTSEGYTSFSDIIKKTLFPEIEEGLTPLTMAYGQYIFLAAFAAAIIVTAFLLFNIFYSWPKTKGEAREKLSSTLIVLLFNGAAILASIFVIGKNSYNAPLFSYKGEPLALTFHHLSLLNLMVVIPLIFTWFYVVDGVVFGCMKRRGFIAAVSAFNTLILAGVLCFLLIRAPGLFEVLPFVSIGASVIPMLYDICYTLVHNNGKSHQPKKSKSKPVAASEAEKLPQTPTQGGTATKRRTISLASFKSTINSYIELIRKGSLFGSSSSK